MDCVLSSEPCRLATQLQAILSNGSPGFFSENIAAGVGMTAEEAVRYWTGDDPHLNTMISSNLQDIGAGVAVSGNTYYYVIDCGLSTGGTPAAFTPPPSYKPPHLRPWFQTRPMQMVQLPISFKPVTPI